MVVSTEELKKMIDSKTSGKVFDPETSEKISGNNLDYVLIDVRREDELHHGMIPTAKHICLDEIESAFGLDDKEFKEKYGFDKPSKEELIIVHCRTGGRSNVAASFLNSKGYHVQNYQGSVQEWSKIDDNVKMY